ncbi:pyridoxamine 5'-phosphate oxidase family protein [Rhodophyticola sp. MJ-SS7]|nr:MSMEG_1061 family FMN-dependent PPOX-type flavoprotein [Rhodophyticola sp. MJ-SS7]MDU8944035.1 pyridoxamine 5'-phosphate oxidase family protein [Rhodophyticola sp. MJ-SS7]
MERARFCILATVGPEGTDTSPRGDDGPVVTILDDATLALPDWRGNNRADSLRNIVRDGRVSLMLMVPGASNVVRINGTANLTGDEALRARFAKAGKAPRTVTVIRISKIYFQCARALVRARLWAGEDDSARLPTAGDLIAKATTGDLGGPAYDGEWNGRAANTLW